MDNKTLGYKNSIPLEPYLKWVLDRSQKLTVPYPSILPVIMEPVVEGDVPYTILHPYMPTSIEDLQKGWIQLKEDEIFSMLNYMLVKRGYLSLQISYKKSKM